MHCADWGSRFSSSPSPLWLAHDTPVTTGSHGCSNMPGMSQPQGLCTCPPVLGILFSGCPHSTPSSPSGLLKYNLRELLPANGSPHTPSFLVLFLSVSLFTAQHSITLLALLLAASFPPLEPKFPESCFVLCCVLST